MKRQALITTIAKMARKAGVAFTLRRHGANHDVYDLGGAMIVVPRHAEINEMTAQAILKQARAALGQ